MKNNTSRATPLALIAAGGEGKRLGALGPKALVLCAGRPLLAWCLDGFAASRTYGLGAGLVVVAAHASDLPAFEAAVEPARAAGLDIVVCEGGPSRSHSVAAALRAGLAQQDVDDPGRIVLVQDAARVSTPAQLIDGIAGQLAAHDDLQGLIAAAPVTDTIKRVGAGNQIVETPPREQLWAVQTPQGFRASALADALETDDAALTAATDDAMLVERGGGRVEVYEWTIPNPKITTQDDLIRAESSLRSSG